MPAIGSRPAGRQSKTGRLFPKLFLPRPIPTSAFSPLSFRRRRPSRHPSLSRRQNQSQLQSLSRPQNQNRLQSLSQHLIPTPAQNPTLNRNQSPTLNRNQSPNQSQSQSPNQSQSQSQNPNQSQLVHFHPLK